MKSKSMKKHHKGFTLMEVIVVIAILAILAAVAVPTITGYIEKAKETNDLQIAQNLVDAAAIALVLPSNKADRSLRYTVIWNSITGQFNVRNQYGGTIIYTDIAASICDTMNWENINKTSVSQSKKAESQKFIFSINSETGEIVIGDANGDGDNKDTNVLGVNEVSMYNAWGPDGIGINH